MEAVKRLASEAMQRWRLIALLLGASVASGAVGCWLVMHFAVDRWKPTGDGRTVLNTQTGEIRIAATGQTVSPPRLSHLSAEEWQRIARENGTHYNAAQAILLSATATELQKVDYHTGAFWLLKRDFEEDVFPSKDHRDNLATGIATCLRAGAVDGAKWQQLYDHLQAMRFDCPAGCELMQRSPEQLGESRAILLNTQAK